MLESPGLAQPIRNILRRILNICSCMHTGVAVFDLLPKLGCRVVFATHRQAWKRSCLRAVLFLDLMIVSVDIYRESGPISTLVTMIAN